MATRAAILRSVARCAILLERTLLKLLDNWVRQQAARLDMSQALGSRALGSRALGSQASGPRQQRKNRQPRPHERNQYDRIIRHTNQPAR
jgi:hypothetical protein